MPTAFYELNGKQLDPLLHGSYPGACLEDTDAPEVAPGDMKLIHQPLDFLGYNIYSGGFHRKGMDGHSVHVPFSDEFPSTANHFRITPQAITWSLQFTDAIYGPQAYIISENGAAYSNEPDVHGRVDDVERIQFLRLYLQDLQRSIQAGRLVRGYFLWSFLDNFEWAEGYGPRFGLVHIDYRTQKRTPKLSAAWYAQVAQNGLLI